MSTAFANPPSRTNWVGRTLSGIVIAFMMFDGGIKLMPLGIVTDTMRDLGFQPTDALARGLGILLLGCTALYAWPRTATLGAILLTGYLGGAIATQLRVGNPVFSHLLFGVYLGLMLWGGLWLRDPRLRALIPVG